MNAKKQIVIGAKIKIRLAALGLALGLVAIASLGLAGCASAAPAQPTPHRPSGPPLLGTAPALELTNQDGARVKLSDLRGKVVLINFFYTSCPDVCQLQNHDFKAIKTGLGEAAKDNLVLVSISFDPEVDTPQRLKSYAWDMGFSTSGWHFLTGSSEEITKVTGEYGIIYRLVPAEKHVHEGGEVHPHARAFEHLSQVLIIDQNGVVRRQMLGIKMGDQVFPREDLSRDIAALLRAP